MITITPFQNNTCYVDGYCFDDKEAHPNDWCKICDPKTNTFVKRTEKGSFTSVLPFRTLF